MSVMDLINNNLKTLFNINDDVYKSLICDAEGTIPETITIPTDIDIGVMASMVEYLRLLSIDLVSQIYLNQADGELLEYQLEDFFNSLRAEGESDTEWIARTISQIFSHKVSNATIIYAMRPYSSQEPIITLGTTGLMFADVSFADRYRRYDTEWNGMNFSVFPSYAKSDGSTLFSIIITLYDTQLKDLHTIVGLLNKYIAAGIAYTLILLET